MLHAQRLAVIASAAFIVAAAPSGAANTPANVPKNGAGPSSPYHPSTASRHHSMHANACSGVGQYSFVGGPGVPSGPNVAGAPNSGILSGEQNNACGVSSGVAVGLLNETDGDWDFIGGGAQNATGAGLAGYDGVVEGYLNSNRGFASLIGAGTSNTISSFCSSDVCTGGVAVGILAGANNTIVGTTRNTANDSMIGAGLSNVLTGQYAAIVAGATNNENADYGFIGAGSKNAIKAIYASVTGGYANSVSGSYAVIGGGSTNAATGKNAVIPGGFANKASGLGSFAAGQAANALHDGAFVWSDEKTAPAVKSTGVNQFIARASGGVTFYSSINQSTGVHLAAGSGSWSNVSDRAVKTAIAPLDDAMVLAKVASLPVSEWSYIAQGTGVRHVGPMAQDFYEAFGVGEDNKHITTIDEGGVALAAIKGLSVRTERENAALRARLEQDQVAFARDNAEIASLRSEMAHLASTVAKLHPTR